MKFRQPALLFGASVLILAACSGGGEVTPERAEIELRTPLPNAGAVVESVVETVAAVDVESAGMDEILEALLVETQAEIDAVQTECSSDPGRVQQGADFSNRTFSGPDLRCADLTDASFRGAVLEGVDLSGANLTGADFTGATVRIIAVGADFTRATLNGANFEKSDLRGARFASADLSGSTLTTLDGGLTLADLGGAQLGCNVLHGSPGVNLSGTVVVDDCRTLTAFNRVTLSGSWYAGNLVGLDFDSIFVSSIDFRRADLTSVNLSDYGVFPAGADFSGALLVDSDLSGVGFYDSIFVGTDFSGSNLAGVFAATTDFSGANFEQVSMIGFGSERSSYVEAVFEGVDLTGGSLSFDDFSGAVFGEIDATDLVIDTIACPGAVSSTRFGLCTVGTDVAF